MATVLAVGHSITPDTYTAMHVGRTLDTLPFPTGLFFSGNSVLVLDDVSVPGSITWADSTDLITWFPRGGSETIALAAPMDVATTLPLARGRRYMRATVTLADGSDSRISVMLLCVA